MVSYTVPRRRPGRGPNLRNIGGLPPLCQFGDVWGAVCEADLRLNEEDVEPVPDANLEAAVAVGAVSLGEAAALVGPR